MSQTLQISSSGLNKPKIENEKKKKKKKEKKQKEKKKLVAIKFSLKTIAFFFTNNRHDGMVESNEGQ